MDECSLCSSSSRSDIGQKRESFYVQCSSCGLIRISPHPTDEQLADYYQNYLDRGRAANPKKKRLRALIRAWFLRLLAPGNKFLEIGCNVTHHCSSMTQTLDLSSTRFSNDYESP